MRKICTIDPWRFANMESLIRTVIGQECCVNKQWRSPLTTDTMGEDWTYILLGEVSLCVWQTALWNGEIVEMAAGPFPFLKKRENIVQYVGMEQHALCARHR